MEARSRNEYAVHLGLHPKQRGTTIDQLHFVVLGPGRAGTTMAARLLDAGLRARIQRDRSAPVVTAADVVILAVPDGAIPELAAGFPPQTWLVHLSGATPLDALGASRRRAFVLHPMQTLSRAGGASQLDGVQVTVTAASPEALAFAMSLGRRLGLELQQLAESVRPLPHLAAALAGNGGVTLVAEGMRILAAAGFSGPDAASLLGPLLRTGLEGAIEAAADGRTILPTGPVARGDAATVRRHRAALVAHGLADLDPLYVELARATRRLAHDEPSQLDRDLGLEACAR